MELTPNPYKVYVKTNDSGYVTEVNSSAFLSDLTGWTEIDKGHGDKFHHAQGNYFPEPIMTMGGAYRYKLMAGAAVMCTAEDLEEQTKKNGVSTGVSLEERINKLESNSSEIRKTLSAILSRLT